MLLILLKCFQDVSEDSVEDTEAVQDTEAPLVNIVNSEVFVEAAEVTKDRQC